MQNIKAKKESIEQIISKLKLSENNEVLTKKVDSNTKNAQKQANSDLLEGINVESSKLQANKIEKSNPNRDGLGRFTFGKKLFAPDTGVSGGNNNSKNKEVKHEGEYVLTSKGSKDFGEITPEMAKIMRRQAGKIRLRVGEEHDPKIKEKPNYGEEHINRDLRTKNLNDIGFSNARDFVEFICDDISYIFSNGKSLIAVREKDSHYSGAWMELTPNDNDDFYDVKTASPLRKDWYKNKTPLWINPKIGVLNKSLGDPLAHQFKKNIESIYGIVSHSKNIIPNSQNKSRIKPDYDGKNVLHKSFDIVVTDITENNKRQKVEQVEKALNAMYTNTPFAIKHIKADSSPRYDDVILRISDFDRNKIEKAVHNMAFSLDTTVKNSKGEAFIYKAQEDLTDKWTAFFSSYVRGVYNFVVSYFGLPEITVMRKADADLTYKGKVLYSPETGTPIKESEWKRFCELLEKFLNRKIKDADKKIVLESASLGKILNRMLKYNTLETVTKQRLDNIKYHGKKLEWISDTVQNMESATKTPLTRYEQARLQVMTQSAGNRITGITERMKMDVQQILIDGVKDRKSKSVISQNLFDKMTGENRDFQRIVDTEIQNAVNNGFLLEEVHSSEEGEKVYFKRVEIMDENTCPYCSKINGLVAVWSETPVEGVPKDEYAKAVIWEGKDWDGKKLTSFDEVPCGPCHPYCRGSWTRWTPGRTARIDAMVAQITGKGKKWHEAVNEAREEFRAKGIEEPSDATKGYTDRINELYEEKLK